jgi:hypothetical protein
MCCGWMITITRMMVRMVMVNDMKQYRVRFFIAYVCVLMIDYVKENTCDDISSMKEKGVTITNNCNIVYHR